MEKILEIIRKIKPGVKIDENTKLVDEGVLTSFEMYKLVIELDNEYDIEISPLEMTPNNFNTVESIEKLVTELQEA